MGRMVEVKGSLTSWNSLLRLKASLIPESLQSALRAGTYSWKVAGSTGSPALFSKAIRNIPCFSFSECCQGMPSLSRFQKHPQALKDVVEDGVRNSSSAFWLNSRPWMMHICLRKMDLPLSPAPSSRILSSRPIARCSRASSVVAALSDLGSELRATPALRSLAPASADSKQRLRVRTTHGHDRPQAAAAPALRGHVLSVSVRLFLPF